MTLQGVCDAWVTELTTPAYVTGLDTAEQHKYASWAMEQLVADGARHLAVWPNGDRIETVIGNTTQPSDLLTEQFSVLVWEDAASEATRLYDSDVDNIAWLALFEAIRARFYINANVSGSAALAGANTYTRYQGGTMGLRGTTRLMEITFTVRFDLAYS